MSARPLSLLVPTLFGLLGLACMCGGPTETEPSFGAPGYDPTQLGVAPAEAPTAAPVYAAPAAPAAPAAAPAVAAAGFAPTIRGVCEMERACGCAEKESVDACEASLQKSAIVFDSITLSCITTQECASMCGGGGVRCIEQAQARISAQMSAEHNTVMGIINNYPTGGPCPAGMVETVNYAGQHVGCR